MKKTTISNGNFQLAKPIPFALHDQFPYQLTNWLIFQLEYIPFFESNPKPPDSEQWNQISHRAFKIHYNNAL